MALSIGLWEGGKIILGLNGLRGSCDQVGFTFRLTWLTCIVKLIQMFATPCSFATYFGYI